MATTALVGNNSVWNPNDLQFPRKPIDIIVHDGGIVAPPDDKPKNPFICKEERPTTIDLNTGELIYTDKIKSTGCIENCWMA